MTDQLKPPTEVTLFDGLNTARPLNVDAEPGATGRWQPVRAGVVNSWAWIDEQFLFRDGWTALVGPNGSGKSLTSGGWVPTMLDGDVRPAALSMSQRASGTLADRHHNRNPDREKTGLWWLEFGLRGTDEATQWFTLGLWIRWRGANADRLEQAWFTVPARVGSELILQRDSVPADIDGLTEQLTALNGQLFTSHDRLLKAANRQHTSVHDDSAYAEAVRTQLFPMIDGDQMDAMTSVLRALRSVRVNDRMTANEMHSTLTSALPALPSQYTGLLANNLGQLEDLQGKLDKAGHERDLLVRLSRLYVRYADNAAAVIAYAVLAAAAEVQRAEKAAADLERETGEEKRRQTAADEAHREAEQELAKLRISAEVLKNRTQGHPGAHLPAMTGMVKAAQETARLAASHADQRLQESGRARKEQDEATEVFTTNARHVSTLANKTREHAQVVKAEAFCEPIRQVTTLLTSGLDQDAHLEANGIPAAAEAVSTWVHQRETTIQKIHAANSEVEARQRAQDQAEGRHHTAATELRDAQQQVEADQQLVDTQDADAQRTLEEFNTEHGAVLGRVPMVLLASIPLNPGEVSRWADQALNKAIGEINLAKVEADAAAATRRADLAAQLLVAAEADAARAVDAAQRSGSQLTATLADLPDAPSTTIRWATTLQDAAVTDDFEQPTGDDQAITDADERARALRRASDDIGEAQGHQHRADEDAAHAGATAENLSQASEIHRRQLTRRDDEVAAFLGQVQQWTSGLRVLVLEPDEIPDLSAARDGDLSSHALRVADAQRRAEPPLRDRIMHAERAAEQLGVERNQLLVKIAERETGQATPPAPSWRPDRSSRQGAPFWDLVDFAPSITEDRQAAIEGALLVGGLLDAWVDPHCVNADPGDTLLRPAPAVSGPSLADVLVAHPNAETNAEHIEQILRGISLSAPTIDGTVLAADQWHTPWLTAAAPAGWQPQYIGAAARAERQRQELEQLRAQLAELEPRVMAASDKVVELRELLAVLGQEAHLPNFDSLVRERDQLVATNAAVVAAQSANRDATTRAGISAKKAEDAWQTAAASCATARVPVDAAAIEAAARACATAIRHLHESRTVVQLLVAAQSANHDATTRAGISTQKAEDAWQTAAASCATARVPVDATAIEAAARACATAIRQLHESRTVVQLLVAAMTSRTAQIGEKAALDSELDAAQLALTAAEQRDRQVRSSRAALPHFTELEAGLQELAASEVRKEQAEAAERRTRGDYEQARTATDLSRTERRRVATTQDGRQLPVERDALDHFRADVRRLAASCAAWVQSSERLQLERGHAQKAVVAATEALRQAKRAEVEAQNRQEAADAKQYQLDEETRLYEKPYRDMLEELRINGEAQEELGRQSERHRELRRAAEILLGRLEERATTTATVLNAAHEDRRIADEQLNELFDHNMIADITDGDSYQRPADSQQSSKLAQRLTRHSNTEHARDQLKREGHLLNTELRRVAEVFLRMGRHIIDQEFGTAGLRRIVLAESVTAADTGNGKSLKQAVDEISDRLERLQNDYDEQLRKEIKGSLLEQLRGQILTRIQLADDIVKGISKTLKGVRTGVENVGVRIAWDRRTDDPEAVEALYHIEKPNADGNYDDMYNFFTTRLRTESGNETTAERIARVFDYRNWFAWKIEVTHKAFSDDAHPGEVFKEITSRRNPLDTLSTGEKRLASMLPLLAAIRSFYATPGHNGPRLAYIDELDAALDKTNLRMLLHLLRDWDFDVISTLPSMNKLLVPEVRSTAIHKIIKSSGGNRFSIPYIWDGTGLPQAVRIAVPGANASDEGGPAA
ncbi:hypothetical protein Ani05nite_50820 [Amorphoplanes nipponensis]|uniref:Exonuclease SbcCD, C subunit n=1 Tax=Actinoplanes nipponensis TaxID=135950 RepID=A0A919JKX2_9ACTN|nr:SbcC/MukB-like Walker B domain-containing protein [Actinoplanes nipponensis]GIE51548.1 hypothetical protein Ani05nite_50820 [Actinoplanes nipponensis]